MAIKLLNDFVNKFVCMFVCDGTFLLQILEGFHKFWKISPETWPQYHYPVFSSLDEGKRFPSKPSGSKAKNGQWFYVIVFSFLLEFYSIIPNQRDSHWRCFIKMLFLKYSENTHGESTCVGVLFNKIVGWRPATLLKGLQHRCFPVNSQKF